MSTRTTVFSKRPPERDRAGWIYCVVFAVDVVVAGIAVWFFLVGLDDGSVSAFNIELWCALLAGIGGILAVGWFLRARGWPRAAAVVLASLAVPAMLYALLIVTIIASGARWN